MKTLDAINIFDLLTELEHRLQLKGITSDVVSLVIARNTFVDEMKRQAEKEIHGSSSS